VRVRVRVLTDHKLYMCFPYFVMIVLADSKVDIFQVADSLTLVNKLY